MAALVTDMDGDAWLPLGDIQYSNGTFTEFQKVYDLQFGHLLPITYPVPGNHGYGTEDAAGYFAYFGDRAHGPEGYYSFTLCTLALQHHPSSTGARGRNSSTPTTDRPNGGSETEMYSTCGG